MPVTADALGLRNFELFTNCANCTLFDFSMAGDTGGCVPQTVRPSASNVEG